MQRGVVRDGETGCFPQLSELGEDFFSAGKSSWELKRTV